MQGFSLWNRSLSERELPFSGSGEEASFGEDGPPELRGAALISPRLSHAGPTGATRHSGHARVDPGIGNLNSSDYQGKKSFSSSSWQAIYIISRLVCVALLISGVVGALLRISTILAKDGYLGSYVNCEGTQIENGVIFAGKLNDLEKVVCEDGYVQERPSIEPRRCRLVMKSCLDTEFAGGDIPLDTKHNKCPKDQPGCVLKKDDRDAGDGDREYCKVMYAYSTADQAAEARAAGNDETSVLSVIRKTGVQSRCVSGKLRAELNGPAARGIGVSHPMRSSIAVSPPPSRNSPSPPLPRPSALPPVIALPSSVPLELGILHSAMPYPPSAFASRLPSPSPAPSAPSAYPLPSARPLPSSQLYGQQQQQARKRIERTRKFVSRTLGSVVVAVGLVVIPLAALMWTAITRGRSFNAGSGTSECGEPCLFDSEGDHKIDRTRLENDRAGVAVFAFQLSTRDERYSEGMESYRGDSGGLRLIPCPSNQSQAFVL